MDLFRQEQVERLVANPVAEGGKKRDRGFRVHEGRAGEFEPEFAQSGALAGAGRSQQSRSSYIAERRENVVVLAGRGLFGSVLIAAAVTDDQIEDRVARRRFESRQFRPHLRDTGNRGIAQGFGFDLSNQPLQVRAFFRPRRQSAKIVERQGNFMIIGMGLPAAPRSHGLQKHRERMFPQAGASECQQFIHGIGGKCRKRAGKFDLVRGIRVKFAECQVKERFTAALVITLEKSFEQVNRTVAKLSMTHGNRSGRGADSWLTGNPAQKPVQTVGARQGKEVNTPKTPWNVFRRGAVQQDRYKPSRIAPALIEFLLNLTRLPKDALPCPRGRSILHRVSIFDRAYDEDKVRLLELVITPIQPLVALVLDILIEVRIHAVFPKPRRQGQNPFFMRGRIMAIADKDSYRFQAFRPM